MSGVLSLVNGLQAEQTEVTLPPMSCSELRLPYQNTKPKIIDKHRKRAGGRPAGRLGTIGLDVLQSKCPITLNSISAC